PLLRAGASRRARRLIARIFRRAPVSAGAFACLRLTPRGRENARQGRGPIKMGGQRPPFLVCPSSGHRLRAVPVFTGSVEPLSLFLFLVVAFPDAKPLRTFAGNAQESRAQASAIRFSASFRSASDVA